MSHPLQERIGLLRTRVRRLLTLYAISWIVGAVVAAMIVLGLADYLLRFQDRGLRVIAWLCVLGVLAWTVWRRLLAGLAVPLSDVELARRLQRRFPKLGDSLASAVEFLGQPEDDPTAGSFALRRAVIAQTTAQADPLDFRKALRPAPAWRAAAAALAICAVAMVLIVADPLSSRIALARLINPFGSAAWPQMHHLTVVEPVITRVAKGQTFEVEVVDAAGIKLPDEVRIYYRFQNPDGSVAEESEPMRFIDGRTAARQQNGTADPRRQHGVMLARRENVTRPFSYRVEGGDDRSMPWTAVEVVDPPALESFSARLFPPEYTGWPTEEAERQIRALVGTRVVVAARSTKPLQSAVLCLEGGPKIEARVSGEEQREISAEFMVQKSGAYWVELTDAEGLTGGSDARWDLRAVPDAPPSVSIDQPTASVFVTQQATVPLRVSAKDDLAVHRIELAFSRSDRSEQAEATIPLYEGPERVAPQAAGLGGGADLGQNLVLPVYAWRLADLGLEPGTQVTLYARATDYRPNTGTSDARRLVVITPAELTERIAARQGSILSELGRVLEMQKQSRREVGELEIQSREVGRLRQREIDQLRGAELNQRQIAHTLASRSEGVPAQVLDLLAELENNRVDSPDVKRQMQALLDEIGRLEREHLPSIERELTAAIKTAQVRLQEAAAGKDGPLDGKPSPQPDGKSDAQPGPKPQPDPAIVDPLAAAGKHQGEVIASLERALGELGQWDRYRQFHTRMSQILRQQEAIRQSTRELGGRTLTKSLADLTPQQSADLKILARRQFELASELDGVLQAMDEARATLTQSNPLVAAAVADALYRAGELAVAGQMRSAAAAIQQNQMGQAIGREGEAIEGLREILDILSNRRENELERLLQQLGDAEHDLARMTQAQQDVARQLDEAAAIADQAERRRELERLARLQHELQEEAERMARRLERLLAQAAAQSVAQAAAKMGQAAQCAGQGDCQGASNRAGQAKAALDEARRQVARRRQEAEVQLALEQLARLEEALGGMRRRQETVLQETLRLDKLAQDQGQLTRAQAASLNQLARQQELLQSETASLSQRLLGADVFTLALSGCAREMGRAAALLDRRQTGRDTQHAEQNALRRLDQLLEALKPEEREKPDPSGNADSAQGGQGQSNQPSGSGLHTLAELKLLRLLQQEINRRTEELERDFGRAGALPDEARAEYTSLSEEQGKLADLLLDLIQPQEAPSAAPEEEGSP